MDVLRGGVAATIKQEHRSIRNGFIQISFIGDIHILIYPFPVFSEIIKGSRICTP
jgi:hypothetical protein